MILKLTFENPKPNSAIPLNYQYYLGSWIYKIIAEGDHEFAKFLHEKGYVQGAKNFKLFTFSLLKVPEYRIDKEREQFVIRSSTFSLEVRFLIDQAMEQFVMGLFKTQQLEILTNEVTAVFPVTQVESLGLQVPTTRVRIRTLSPMVVGRKNDKGHDDYLPPTDKEFGNLLLQNLIDKYLASGKNLDPNWAAQQPEFKLLNPEKVNSKLVTLKEGHKSQTKVKGYLFDFEYTAPTELLETGLLAGFGKYNSMGFGCGEVVMYVSK
jgi:CRISPR-associated endoribonuclease Cas6